MARRPARLPNLTLESVMVTLAVLSVALIFWHDLAVAEPDLREVLVLVDLVVVVVFAVEWVWRLARSDDRVGFLTRNWYDLPGLVPLALSSSGVWRLFRLFRIVRLLRALPWTRSRIERIGTVASRSNILPLVGVSASVTLAGALLVWLVERDTNVDLASYGEALWWAVVTVTTVGYGDITPATAIGRAIAVMLMALGIGIIGLLASQLAATLMEGRGRRQGGGTDNALDERLARLAALHRDGSLTDDEFARAKARVLEAPG